MGFGYFAGSFHSSGIPKEGDVFAGIGINWSSVLFGHCILVIGFCLRFRASAYLIPHEGFA
jgi:hypothetical protein